MGMTILPRLTIGRIGSASSTTTSWTSAEVSGASTSGASSTPPELAQPARNTSNAAEIKPKFLLKDVMVILLLLISLLAKCCVFPRWLPHAPLAALRCQLSPTNPYLSIRLHRMPSLKTGFIPIKRPFLLMTLLATVLITPGQVSATKTS